MHTDVDQSVDLDSCDQQSSLAPSSPVDDESVDPDEADEEAENEDDGTEGEGLPKDCEEGFVLQGGNDRTAIVTLLDKTASDEKA